MLHALYTGTCPLLSAPVNGQVSCSLGDDGEANNGDSCDFTCDGGLVLHGSASRSCTGGIWSGDESLCVPGLGLCKYQCFYIVKSLKCFQHINTSIVNITCMLACIIKNCFTDIECTS